jgi:hypothetical protein
MSPESKRLLRCAARGAEEHFQRVEGGPQTGRPSTQGGTRAASDEIRQAARLLLTGRPILGCVRVAVATPTRLPPPDLAA